LGVIGLGRIGTAVALRARALGLRVVFYDPYRPDGSDKALGVSRAFSVEELLQTADIVTLHAPLTEETRGMVDEKFLAAMRRGAILVNTARGPIVKDLGVLVEFIRNGHLSGVGLDVLPQEPIDADDPVVRAWRAGEEWIRHKLIVTPHAAFYSVEALQEMRQKAARMVRTALEGQPLSNVVNREFLAAFPENKRSES
jgi:phosphoglycerate dehydrogenase-like enzyme